MEEDKQIAELQEFFLEQCRTTWHPDTPSFRYALAMSTFDQVKKAIILASGQCRGGPTNKWKYANAIMRNWRQADAE